MIGSIAIAGPHSSGLCRQKKVMITVAMVMTVRSSVSIHFAILVRKEEKMDYEVEILRNELEFDVRFYGRMRGIYRMERRIETLGNSDSVQKENLSGSKI